MGLREGNFLVKDDKNEPMFVAHHHSDQDVQFIAAPYQHIESLRGESLSMHGNSCQMFEFVGRKMSLLYPSFHRTALEPEWRVGLNHHRSSALRVIHCAIPELVFLHFPRADAPAPMLSAARKLEEQFSIEFDSLTHFPSNTLAVLEQELPESADIARHVTVASHSDPEVLPLIETLTGVANAPSISTDRRAKYWDTLLAIYGRLSFQPSVCKSDSECLFVGIRREGFRLAKALGYMPEGHSIAPHAKRIPLPDGLLVGLSGIPKVPPYRRCVVVDGAIASGATLIAILERLQSSVRSFQICSAHATMQGLRAILHYGEMAGLHIDIAVGHVTSGLNSHYYATLPGAPDKLVVGDLGDTIGEIG